MTENGKIFIAQYFALCEDMSHREGVALHPAVLGLIPSFQNFHQIKEKMPMLLMFNESR